MQSRPKPENVFLQKIQSNGQDNQGAADRVLDEIEENFLTLAEHPQMGRLLRDIAPELRYFAVGNYLLLYRTIPDGIQIIRVIHGARDLPHLF